MTRRPRERSRGGTRPGVRLVAALVPPRLGVPFRWLLASSWATNLGDGVALAAGPLLVASQTSDPRLVALAALLQRLPWLVLGLYAGTLADRLDRRLVVLAVDLVRAGVLTVLALAVATGRAPVAVVLPALLLLGTAEVFADTTSRTLLPMVVDRRDLAVGNARLQAGFLALDQLGGPPLGAALFAAGAVWPFACQAVLVALGALLVSRLVLPPHGQDREVRRHVRHDVVEGLRWTLHSPPVRTLALTILVFNVTFGAAWSVLVLYASERLGLGAVGFGLLTAVSAVGGVLGIASYGWLTRRVRLGDLMRVGLVVETLTHLVLARTTRPAVAMAVLLVFGAHAFVWGTTSVTVLQRAVPSGLLGRVTSVHAMCSHGGLVVGAAVGGLLAQRAGLTAPFWFAFTGSALLVVAVWRQLPHIAHDADEEPGRAS